MSDIACSKCGGYLVPDYPHGCPPVFRVWSGNESGEKIGMCLHAANHQYAAELWATLYTERAFGSRVRISREDDADVRWFDIGADGTVSELQAAAQPAEPSPAKTDERREGCCHCSPPEQRCDHEGIGLPGCSLCDALAHPRAAHTTAAPAGEKESVAMRNIVWVHTLKETRDEGHSSAADVTTALARADKLAPPDRPDMLWLARCADPKVQDDEDLKTAEALRLLAAEVRRLREESDRLRSHAFRVRAAEVEADRDKLREVLLTIEADVARTAGMLATEMPPPGTPMARVLVAGALLRRECDRLREENDSLRERHQGATAYQQQYKAERDQLREENDRLRTELDGVPHPELFSHRNASLEAAEKHADWLRPQRTSTVGKLLVLAVDEIRRVRGELVAHQRAAAESDTEAELRWFKEREWLVRHWFKSCEVLDGKEESYRLSQSGTWSIQQSWGEVALWEFDHQASRPSTDEPLLPTSESKPAIAGTRSAEWWRRKAALCTTKRSEP